MRRIKKLLPLLTIMLFLSAGLSTEAAGKKEFSAGTKSGIITVTLEECQSIDGEISVKSRADGKTIRLKSATASTSDNSKTEVCEISGNKLYMVTKGDAVTTTVNIDVEFSGEGTYIVTFKGNCTKNDKYEVNGISDKTTIVVGTSTETTETEDSSEEEEDLKEETEESKTEEKDSEKEDLKEGTEESKTEEEDSKKGESKKEESKAEKTETKEAEDEDSEKEKDKTIKKEEENEKAEDERLIEQFLQEAAEEEQQKKTEEKKEEVKKATPKSIGNFLNFLKNFWFVFVILFLILLTCIVLLWRLSRKNRKNDYDGAPMVDYRIEDDD